MTDKNSRSPHSGSEYKERWSLDYFFWSMRNIPGRFRSTTLLAGAFPGTVPGLDISHWQGDLNKEWWATAFNEGYRFVFLKATEGLSFVDPNYAVNKANAREAGFQVGAYCFARPQESGIEQAEVFITTAGVKNYLPR